MVLGGTVVAGIAAAVVAATLSGGGTTRIAAVAAASSSPAAPSVPSSGKLVPISTSPPASKKVTSKRPSAAATAAATRPAANSPAPGAAVATSTYTAPVKAAAPRPHAQVPAPQPVSWWPLNDDDPANTAQDSMGANVATGKNTAWCATGGGVCATFNGSSSAFTTSGPVLDTAPGSSFTVSAEVYMTALNPNNAFETIVSQDGTYDSGFYLQYSGTDKRWAFARVSGDTDAAPPGIRALSTSAPELSTWTHLVGVYDAPDGQLRLYVNGVLEGTATDSSPFAATGDLVIGRAQFDGQPTDWFNGAADQVKVYNKALTTAQVEKI